MLERGTTQWNALIELLFIHLFFSREFWKQYRHQLNIKNLVGENPEGIFNKSESTC